MFVLLPLLRRLANHARIEVVIAVGGALLAGGIAVAVVGITSHRASLTRLGVVLLIALVVFAVVAVRARRARVQN